MSIISVSLRNLEPPLSNLRTQFLNHGWSARQRRRRWNERCDIDGDSFQLFQHICRGFSPPASHSARLRLEDPRQLRPFWPCRSWCCRDEAWLSQPQQPAWRWRATQTEMASCDGYRICGPLMEMQRREIQLVCLTRYCREKQMVRKKET